MLVASRSTVDDAADEPVVQETIPTHRRLKDRWSAVDRVERRFLLVLLLLFLAKGVVITYVHQPFSGHDEVAHYAYLQMMAEHGRIPKLPDLVDWRAAYSESGTYTHDRIPAEFWQYCRRATIDWSPGCEDPKFANQAIYAMSLAGKFFPTGWIYTANHPPLYYLVMTPLYLLVDNLTIQSQLTAFRLAALPFGLVTVVFAWLTARTLFPRERFLALMVPAFVAFQPQIAYESAMLNNDILAIAFTSAVIYLIVRGLKTGFPIGTVALIGLGYGLAVLSKNTSLTTGAIIAFAMILGIGVRKWREWIAKGAIAATIAGLLIWPWYLYLWRTYGDFTGLARIRELQYWNYDGSARPTIWAQLKSQRFAWWRWRETWGEFGWRLIPIGDPDDRGWWLLRILLWVTMIAAIGVAVWAIRLYRTQHAMIAAYQAVPSQDAFATVDGTQSPVSEAAKGNIPLLVNSAPRPSIVVLEKWQVVGVLTMGMTCLLAYFAILQFGTTFSLTQARYYFPAIVPAAVLFMLGIRSLTPQRWLPYVQAGLFLGMVLLNVVIYTAYVLPYWATVNIDTTELNQFYR